MKKANSTGKSLLLSSLALVMSLVLLIGSTFAWFTDSASTSVNTIVAGELKVDLVDANGLSLRNGVLSFVNNEGSSDIRWEPGVTFTTAAFQVKSIGTLALKYKLAITGLDGSEKLLKVIRFSLIDEQDRELSLDSFEGVLTPEAPVSQSYRIKAHMDESAGNTYQGETINSLGITVYATQYTYENDSISNTYDSLAFVSTAEQLKAALNAGKSVVLASDITINETVSVGSTENPDQKVTLDFNGKKIFLTGEWSDFPSLEVNCDLTLTDSRSGGGIDGSAAYNASDKVPTALFVNNGASLTMQGGTIENVYRGVANYYSGGTFTMTGGKIAVRRPSEIESCGVYFHRTGSINLLGGEVYGSVAYEKTASLTPTVSIGEGFVNSGNTVLKDSGLPFSQNPDGTWSRTIAD